VHLQKIKENECAKINVKLIELFVLRLIFSANNLLLSIAYPHVLQNLCRAA